MKAVAIVSGGMDSVTLAHLVRESKSLQRLHLLSFNYGQRHVRELECAQSCAERLGADWSEVDLRSVGELISTAHSSLVNPEVEVPEGHYAEETMVNTIVPNRNAIMLNIAVGVAIADDAELVYTGVHAGDHAVYPDCRPEFIQEMNRLVQIATETHVKVEAPFVHLTKAEIAGVGDTLKVPWAETWSCYKGGGIHCGRCSTCVERQEAFHLAGVFDPTSYIDPDFWKEAVAAHAEG